MDRARELLVEIDSRRGKRRASLHENLREAIQTGRLHAGARLPSSRQLASDLGVSRGVVSETYDQLVAEGYLEVVPRSAPVVARVRTSPPPATRPEPTRFRHDFASTAPDLALYPRRLWVRAVERALREAPDAVLDYGDHRGLFELRVALSEYLARVRGVRAEPDRIVVTQGFTQALDLVCRVLAARGTKAIAVENPSMPDVWPTVRNAGVRLEPCPVDEEGLVPSELRAPAVVVTPAHQFPTGALLSPHRRAALLERAELVIEDDYDAEFRYDRRPIGAVQGLDPDRVAHIGTASKTLAPGVRIGWLTLPAHLVDDVRDLKKYTDSGSPAVDQLAFAHLLASGGYERHVNRARTTYRSRRDRLVEALAAKGIPVHGPAAGLHLVLPLPDSVDDVRLAATAASTGIGVRPLSSMYVAEPARKGLLLGFARLREERAAEAVLALSGVLPLDLLRSAEPQKTARHEQA